MSLLVRIAEFFIIIVLVRAFLRMIAAGNIKPPPSGHRPEKAERFDGKEHDISDADYEDVT